MKYLLLSYIVLTLLCGCSPAEKEPHDETPGDLSEMRVDMEDRVVRQHVAGNGWSIVSRWETGEEEHQGEGLLWWGVAQYVLPSEKARALWPALIARIEANDGGLWRHDPLGEYAGGREVTWDDAAGFYLGVAAAIAFHGGADIWRPVFVRHMAYLAAHGGELYEGTQALIPPGFDYAFDLVAHRLGLRAAPSDEGLIALETAMPAFISGVLAKRGVCYPMNLSFLTVLTLRVLGVELHGAGREALCLATAGGDVPTLDHYCGRRHIGEYTSTFVPNEWEFRHQRCAAEGADGKPGLMTPALDFLLGLKIGYGG